MKNLDYIKLDSFLKFKNIAQSGGEAKFMIQEGLIKVNDEIEKRRGRKLRKGDFVEVDDVKYFVDELDK